VVQTLSQLAQQGRVLEAEFRPGGVGREWMDAEVLRRLRRRSLAALRKEIEPSPPGALARFYLVWQGIAPPGDDPARREADVDAVYRVVEQLQGAPIPVSSLESLVFPMRLPGYRPDLLDSLGASGEIVWCGAGPLGNKDGYLVLALSDGLELLPPPSSEELSPEAEGVKEKLASRGASFFRELSDAVGSTDDRELSLALWELVWAGWVTNDTLAPLRALQGRGTGTRSHAARRRRRVPRSMPQRGSTHRPNSCCLVTGS
jgi:ATP-dependent Lhr-like helicase